LPNDLRGSGSEEFYDDKFAPLGPIHRGRKPEHLQPSRQELRAFQKQAEPLLDFSRFWIDDAKRQAIGKAFAKVIAERKYTVWACAILSNHAHMVVRRHRDDAREIWRQFANGTLAAVRDFSDVGIDHPVWSTRPYKAFLKTPKEVRGRINDVNGNPQKEKLPPQHFDFVLPYDNWPFHKAIAIRLPRSPQRQKL
jgi:REP element-mobilizing transposase RayT